MCKKGNFVEITFMTTAFQIKPELGTGIYTVPDISIILGIPYSKVNRWIKTFWNDRFAINYGEAYSWKVDLTKAVNFQSLVEINTFYQLTLAGVSSREILRVHDLLSDQFHTPYPFARKDVINQLRSDGKKILFEQKDGSIYTLDITKQFKLGIIRDFFKNLDFGANSLATRLWPLGKDKSIVCDPHHQFGQPVISGTNIMAEAVFELYKAGEPTRFISELYNIAESKIIDAISFCKKAA
jgi:uncharacterized protein (DUF433 family)